LTDDWFGFYFNYVFWVYHLQGQSRSCLAWGRASARWSSCGCMRSRRSR
jgi:hypothetical protein